MKKAVLLINVGSPDSPSLKDVRKYLTEFLNDKHVISLPYLLRKTLVNGIIVPFRAPRSAKLYQRLWTPDGSPLTHYSLQAREKLQKVINGETRVFLAMRYGNPSLVETIKKIRNFSPEKVVVLPLYPQYARSTTETAIEAVKKEFEESAKKPAINFIRQFYDHPCFISTFSNKISKYNPLSFDHIIFSYHGLPLSHIKNIHPKIKEENCICQKRMPGHGEICYKATCYETTRLLAKKLNLPEEYYSVAFQSRFSKNWLSPFTDEVIIQLAAEGKNDILVVAPSFVTDCLETLIEIEKDYKNLFIRSGGKNLTLVGSLNDSDEWIDTLKIMIEKGNQPDS